MVRKTKEAALATREALIDAAERAFRRNGVMRTSLADVAAEAGMTRGAIYWHFRDKAELLEAMCARTTMPMDAALAEAARHPPDDPLAALRALAVEALTRLARDPHTQAVVEILMHKCELSGDLAEGGAGSAQGRASCVAGVEALVRHAVARGQLPADTDVMLAARLLHGGVAGLMHDWVAASDEYDLADAAPALADALVAGVRAAPPRVRAARPDAESGIRKVAARPAARGSVGA
ncbi:MAG: TetR family transcriptional regulator [Burkholderiales bacterium]|nr:TetR family transcriptional regulator [Burkholderiales bacterium]